MTTTMHAASAPTSSTSQRGLLRRIVAGAAPFDGVMGVACLAAAGRIGDWLAIGTTATRGTGVVFLAAAAVGLVTLRRQPLDARPIAAANVVFALWCLAVLLADSPNTLGVVLLAGSVVTAAATAAVEHRLGR
jgi:hypothetical protein